MYVNCYPEKTLPSESQYEAHSRQARFRRQERIDEDASIRLVHSQDGGKDKYCAESI